MLLAVDIGNTNIVIGLLEDKELLFRWRVTSDARRTSDEFGILVKELCGQCSVDLREVSGVAVCSVVPALTEAFVRMCEEVLKIKPVVVGPETDLGITIDYRDPSEVGPDRLANAVGVMELARGPAIVVDFGTATTFDVVTADGHYLGGAIAPGVVTSAENLFRRAALLHGVPFHPPESAIGKTTEESLRSGIIFGVVGQVNEIVRRLSEEWGEKPTVVATGGLAEKISIFTKVINIVEPDLTLLGLALIHERVAGQ